MRSQDATVNWKATTKWNGNTRRRGNWPSCRSIGLACSCYQLLDQFADAFFLKQASGSRRRCAPVSWTEAEEQLEMGPLLLQKAAFLFFFFFLPARSDLTGRVLVFLLVLAVAGSLDFIAPSSSKDNCSRQKDCLVKSTTCWRNYRSWQGRISWTWNSRKISIFFFRTEILK